MRFVYLLTLVVVLMLCLEQIDAKKRGKKGKKGSGGKGKDKKGNGDSKPEPDWDKGYAKACKVMIGDEIVVAERTCGCDTETDDVTIGCTIEAADRTINEQTEKRTFCDVTRDNPRHCDSRLPGLCSVTIDGVEDEACDLVDCDEGSLCTLNAPAKYNHLGQLVQQTYCYKDPGTTVFEDFEGTLENACEIHYLTDDVQTTVGGEACEKGECDTGDENAWTGFTYQEDTQAQAFFCIPEARCDIKADDLCMVLVDGEEVEECTSGCEDDEVCELNAPVRLNEQGEVVQQMFCYKELVAEDDEFEGKMDEACRITFTDDSDTEQDVTLKECETDELCQTGDLNAWTGLTYQGDENAQAFFCTSTCVKLHDDSEDEDDDEDEDSDEDEDDSQSDNKKGGKKGGKSKGGKKRGKKGGKGKP